MLLNKEFSGIEKEVLSNANNPTYAEPINADEGIVDRLKDASKVHYVSQTPASEELYKKESELEPEEAKKDDTKDIKVLEAKLDIKTIEKKKYKNLDNSAFSLKHNWVMAYLNKQFYTKVCHEMQDFIDYLYRENEMEFVF